jgi:hypothetical protein
VVDKNYKYIIYAILGYGVYVLLLYGIWNLILYIGVGGIEHDTAKITSRVKKSYLEKKLLYRMAKVIFRTLPLLAAVILFSK